MPPTSSKSDSNVSIRRFCAVWIPRLVQQREFDVSEGIFKVVHETTALALAHKYRTTTSAGLGEGPERSPTHISQHFNYQPKVLMVWRADVVGQMTTIICITVEPELTTLKGLIKRVFAQRVPEYLLAAAFLSIVISTEEILVQDTQEAGPPGQGPHR
jgi:hypothetical protein